MKTAFFGLTDWEKGYIRSHGFSDEQPETVFIDTDPGIPNIPEGNDFEAISIFVDFPVTAATLEKFPALKFIATRSTGFDHIDLSACQARGITVSSVPSYGENTVAEHAFALLLSLSKKIYESYDRLREDGEFSFEGMRGFDLKGKTIGILGTGRIGRHAIKIAQGFSMNVLAYDPYPDEPYAQQAGFTYVSFEELLAKSDIVSIHVPYLPTTHHLFNGETIPKMKHGAYLINTSRGPIVETTALLAALQSGQIAGAGLDVLEEEGVIQDELHFLTTTTSEAHDLKTILANHVLIDLPNVIVTPHNAFNTTEALERILETTVENIRAFESGAPAHVVEPKVA
jgi:D-lactate dehydrogenase